MPSKKTIPVSVRIDKRLLRIFEELKERSDNPISDIRKQALLIGLLVLKARGTAFPPEFTTALEHLIITDNAINDLVDDAFEFGEKLKGLVTKFLDALFAVPNYQAFEMYGRKYHMLIEKYGEVK